MIEITKERAAEIRKSLEGWPGEGAEESEVRTLLRLGLCVVEAFPTAEAIRETIESTKSDYYETQSPKTDALLDALAASIVETAKAAALLMCEANEVRRLRAACIESAREVTQTLGDAIHGPTPDDAPGPVWAMETPETIAIAAAKEIERLRADLAAANDAHEAYKRACDFGKVQAECERLRALLPTEGERAAIEDALSVYLFAEGGDVTGRNVEAFLDRIEKDVTQFRFESGGSAE